MSARDANAPDGYGGGGPRPPVPTPAPGRFTPGAQTPRPGTPAPGAPPRIRPAPPTPPAPSPGAGDFATPPLPRPIARAEDARVEFIPAPIPRRPAPPPPSPPTPMTPAPQTRTSTITVSGRSSPIDGVHADDWAQFAARVAREQPSFHSAHHVGQFRQRRSRLAELGIDPESIVGSINAQHAAFDADMQDAYRHAVDAGLIAEYRGHAIEIPADGVPASIQITLSGVLGVVQAAGLEGAVGWLENPDDRQRFPGTTRAFLRTNGVF